MGRHMPIAALAVLSAVVLGACATGSVASPSSSSSPPSSTTNTATAPVGTPVGGSGELPPPSATPSATPLDVVADIQCTGSTVGGDIDYVEGATGGLPDLASATRALRGVMWTDQVAVDGDHSGVVRDGRSVFNGSWFESATGGWLLFSFSACGDAGISFLPPMGLVHDAMAEVVVDGVRVRGMPSTADESVKFDRLLGRGDLFFVVDGPVQGNGYDWYLGQSLIGGTETGPFGWVAAASRDGEPWIDDATVSTCPVVPDDANRFGVMPVELLVHCFGRTELSFELSANVYCLEEEARQVDPAWLGSGCSMLSGDACGTCGLPIATDPALGVTIPDQEAATWSFRGHFDDPAAATCHAPIPAQLDTPVPEYVAHLCRMTFALTDLTRIGDAE